MLRAERVEIKSHNKNLEEELLKLTAEKVKLERGRHAARAGQSGKTSRNEHKDRDRRKIASNVKASAMAHRETWG